MALTNFKDASRSQSFNYDSVNRLTSAQNAGTDCSIITVNGKTKFWGNSYTYDEWGNLNQKTVTKCGAENLSVASLTNNRLTGYGYDAAGNMTSDPTDFVTSIYDQENRISVATKNGVATTYVYDVDGNRVQKSNGTSGTLYWYMGPGIVAESDLSGNPTSEYVFFNGERVARKDFPSNAVSYYFSDHLKTASVITDSVGNIKAESDYYPWGGELQFSNSDSNHYKFTGKERDGETGLDNFGARYYSSAMGRFMTVDPSSKSINKLNPQSWNRYNYTLNNPLRFVDDNGKWPRDTHEQIIDRAFPGLSTAQRNELKRTSAWVDRLAGQTQAHNHEHAMRGPHEDPAAANRAIDQNIQNHEQAAQRAQGGTPEHAGQINNAALGEFGQALHTVEDRTSPAHTDANGDPRVWNGIPNPLSPAEVQAAEQHNAEEANITPEQTNNSVQAARDAFGQTFGQQALKEAATPPPPPETKKKEEPK